MSVDIVKGDFIIETPWLQLVSCSKEILEAMFKEDESLPALKLNGGHICRN